MYLRLIFLLTLVIILSIEYFTEDATTIDLFEEEIEEEEEEEKYSYFNHLINFVKKYFHIRYLNLLFTILFGTSFIVLSIVLFSDLSTDMIPFKIVPIFPDIPSIVKQLSIFFTFLSFITTNILFMRIVLCLSFFIAIVSISIASSPLDFSYIMWDFLILLINMKHVLTICYDKRHIIFDDDFEIVYKKIFRKVMIRSVYQKLITKSLVRTINKDRYYAKNGDMCNNLTILVYGKMRKIDQTNKISYVKVCSFIDSPEFIMRKYRAGQIFNISFYAETECKIIIWPREMITILLKKSKDLNSLLLASLGIDVSYKVLMLDTISNISNIAESVTTSETTI